MQNLVGAVNCGGMLRYPLIKYDVLQPETLQIKQQVSAVFSACFINAEDVLSPSITGLKNSSEATLLGRHFLWMNSSNIEQNMFRAKRTVT